MSLFFSLILLFIIFFLQSLFCRADIEHLGGTMGQLSIFLLATLLIGCGAPVNFTGEDSAPIWVQDLASEIGSGKKVGSRSNGKKGKLARRQAQPITDQVVPQPSPLPKEEPAGPPQFVADLQEKVEPAIGKRSRQVATTDLVGDTPPEKVVVPPLSTPAMPAAPAAPAAPVKADVVWITDSSNSMLHFLRKVPKTFAGVIPALSPLDWQMMFTNADYGWFSRDGRAMPLEDNGQVLLGQKYLTKNMQNHASIFMDTLRVHKHYEYLDKRGDQELRSNELPPYSQLWNEEPLKALKASFIENDDFHRLDADVLIGIIFSDGEEGEHTDPTERVKAEEVIQAFKDKFGKTGKKLLVYSIIMIPEKDAKCVEKYRWKGLLGGYGGEGVFGVELAHMADQTGGKNFSLCDESYVPLARQIVSDVQRL